MRISDWSSDVCSSDLAGRIDGWFTLRTVGRATWQLLGFAARDLQAGEPFAQMSFWIAASHDLPAATVIRLRAAYDRLRKSGEYNRIIAPLRAQIGRAHV